MNVSDAIKTRRAVKHFDRDHKFTDEELRTLITAAALAPSSFNIQNRHFVVVIDQEIKEKLQSASWGQEQVRDASAVFVMAGDLGAHRNTDRYLRNAPAAVRKTFEPMVGGFYEGKDSVLRDEACRSVGLSAMNLMLCACEMGYASCPMIGFDPAQVSDVLGLDAEHPPLMLVTVGKGTKEARPRLGLLSFEEVVSFDRFGNNGSLRGSIDG